MAAGRLPNGELLAISQIAGPILQAELAGATGRFSLLQADLSARLVGQTPCKGLTHPVHETRIH